MKNRKKDNEAEPDEVAEHDDHAVPPGARSVRGARGAGTLHPNRKGGQRFGGRKKGTPNKVTSNMRTAALAALDKLGDLSELSDQDRLKAKKFGGGGAMGFIMYMLRYYPQTFGTRLIDKLLPYIITANSENKVMVYENLDQVTEAMRQQGIPDYLVRGIKYSPESVIDAMPSEVEMKDVTPTKPTNGSAKE